MLKATCAWKLYPFLIYSIGNTCLHSPMQHTDASIRADPCMVYPCASHTKRNHAKAHPWLLNGNQSPVVYKQDNYNMKHRGSVQDK